MWPGVLLLSCAFGTLLRVGAQETARTATDNVLMLVQGTVEVRRGERGTWNPAKLKDVLLAGDQIRTGERSRAALALASGSVVKLASFSEYEVPPTVAVTAQRGIFEIFNRAKVPGSEVRLPGATAAIRGTDFVLEISPERLAVGVLDGEVTLSNDLGSQDLKTGEQGIIVPGQAPVRARLDLNDPKLIQWSFYYPAVLSLDDLPLSAEERTALGDSINAYLEGNLPNAFQTYAWNHMAGSEAERCYRAELLLSVGQIEQALDTIRAVAEDFPAKRALVTLIAAVRGEELLNAKPPNSASEWLANSYYFQARSDLESARSAARRATELSPNFGFAWARLAELEFSFAERKAAERALESAFALSRSNAHAVALSGFLLSAAGKIDSAKREFDRAIELDSSYANGWLGRGLCLIHQGSDEAGQRDLFVAATLEPQRAIYRSYLGKAFQEVGDDLHARRELDVAKRLDPNDPTGFLYSALLNQQGNRINPAVRELEYAQSTGDKRGIFRSRLLLEEDRAVRGANLAAVYRDAGLQEVSVHEAAQAVSSDYANFSAHLFLANSYNEQRDSTLSNVRYETATFSEYLLANLLSPVGGTPLSQQVSQQEYSRLFERNHLGFSSETTYLSSGQWEQAAAQYGVWGNLAYALEGAYRFLPGDAPNADLDQRALSLQLKQQITPDDSAYFQAVYDHRKYGDLLQYYDPANASPTLRVHEVQDPNLFAGWHHQWSPGSHTLLLFSGLRDELTSQQAQGRVPGLVTDGKGTVTNTMAGFFGDVPADVFDLEYGSDFTAFGAEVQQIWRSPQHTFVAGGRVQHGQVDTRTHLVYAGDLFPGLAYSYDPAEGLTDRQEIHQVVTADLDRLVGYAYWQWRVADPLSLVAGVSVDHISYPRDVVSSLVTDEEQNKTQISPKAGFTWTPHPSSIVRGAYSQSLGGLFYDNSVRLEPVQIAGFNQIYRNLAPDALGPVPGTRFETYDIGSDHRVWFNTYFGWQAELLRSDGDRTLGVFEGPLDVAALVPRQVDQQVEYRERSLLFYANQLIGDGWSFGARYRISDSDFELSTPSISTAAWPESASDRSAILQQVSLDALYNHRSGWFAGLQGLWTMQDNRADDSVLPNEDFWQLNCFGGYRWPRRRAEVTTGLLNITDQDYRLNPVSLYSRLPRERTFFASLRFNF